VWRLAGFTLIRFESGSFLLGSLPTDVPSDGKIGIIQHLPLRISLLVRSARSNFFFFLTDRSCQDAVLARDSLFRIFHIRRYAMTSSCSPAVRRPHIGAPA